MPEKGTEERKNKCSERNISTQKCTLGTNLLSELMYNLGQRQCDKIMKIQYNSKSNWNLDSSYNSFIMD